MASAAELNPYANVRLERMLRPRSVRRLNANVIRYACSADRIDRLAKPPDTLQAFHVSEFDQLSSPKRCDDAEGKSVSVASSSSLDSTLRGPYLGALQDNARTQ